MKKTTTSTATPTTEPALHPRRITNALAKVKRGLVAAYQVPIETPASLSLIATDSGAVVLRLGVAAQVVEFPVLPAAPGSDSLYVLFMGSALAAHDAIQRAADRARRA